MHDAWVSSSNWPRFFVGAALAVSLGSGCDTESEPNLEASFGPDLGETTFRSGAYAPLPFEGNPGELDAFFYVPENLPAGPVPLVVAMHACTQTAAAYRAAGWEQIADEMGFIVLYPQQRSANNGATCFNWAGEYGDPANLQRGEGENQSIINMIEAVGAMHDIDANRVFATGHSGGGAQVALMLATWPDVFAGGGIFAGIPYHCTTTFAQVSTCLSPGITKTAQQHADFVLDAYPSFDGTYPRLSIWHGSSDFLVAPMNMGELVKQWGTVHGIDLTPDLTETVGDAERAEYHNADGEAVIETYLVQGGGHATFNDPTDGCGAAGAYFENRGLCGARLIAEFWGLDQAVDEPGDDDGNSDSDSDPGDDSSASDSASGGSNTESGGGGDDTGEPGDTDDVDDGEGDDSGNATGGGAGGATDGGGGADRTPVKGVGQCALGRDPSEGWGLGLLLLMMGWMRRRG